MNGKKLGVGSLVWVEALAGLALLAAGARAGQAATEIPNVVGVLPGSDRTAFWDAILDQAKPYKLVMDVRPLKKEKFVKGSAKAKADGVEKWMEDENSDERALFHAAIPPNQKLGQHKPVFDGRFQVNGGGKGGKDPTWKVTGIFEVGNHVYENSGAQKNGNPAGAHQINPVDKGIKTYDVDVPVRDAQGNIRTMGDVNAALPKKEVGSFSWFPLQLQPKDYKEIEQNKLKDPKYGDQNMIRIEITETFSNSDEYSITMPKWLQLTDKNPKNRPGKAAVAEWDQFYKALLAHEEGHKKIYDAFIKKVQAEADEYAKTVFYAEVCYGPADDDPAHANNRALELARKHRLNAFTKTLNRIRKLRDAHEKEQQEYDEKTEHGKNQKAVGGVDVIIHTDIPLQ